MISRHRFISSWILAVSAATVSRLTKHRSFFKHLRGIVQANIEAREADDVSTVFPTASAAATCRLA